MSARSLALVAILLAGCFDSDEVVVDVETGSDTAEETGQPEPLELEVHQPANQCLDYPGSLGCPCAPGCMTNLVCEAGRCTPCAGGCGP